MPSIHLIPRTLHVVSVDPNEEDRTESEEFRDAKRRLHEDGHMKCWVCGGTENLQVHHAALEWSTRVLADFAKIKQFVEEFDPYGYGRLLRNKPLTSVEDVRCMLVLCQKHHTGIDTTDGHMGTGIHDMDWPTWLMQKLSRDGLDPVPQQGETAEQALQRIEAALGEGASA